MPDGGSHIALSLGEKEDLVVLGDGKDCRGHRMSGLQSAVCEAGLIEGVLQHGHTGEAVLKVVLHIAVAGYLNE